MKRRALVSLVRSWLGIVAAVLVLGSAGLLTAEYVHAVRVTPAEKALVESLKVQAKTDFEIHKKILRPEFDRQKAESTRRQAIYRNAGVVLLVSLGVFLAWLRWLKPGTGEWRGVPRSMTRWLEGDLDGSSVRKTVRTERTRAGSPSRQPAWGALPERGARHAAGQTAPLPDLAAVDAILQAEGRAAECLIPVLQAIQAHYRFLPNEALRRVAAASEMSPARIAGVASFYGQFRHKPVGEHIIRVCEGTACHVSGASEVRTELRRNLGIEGESDTDPSGRFTIERVACVGSCSLAPVMTIDEKIYGRLTALSAPAVLGGHLAANGGITGPNGHGSNGHGRTDRRNGRPARHASSVPLVEIHVGLGSCGIAGGALAVRDALEAEVAALGGGGVIKAVGCNGSCHAEPIVEVVADHERVTYERVTPAVVRRIVRAHVRPRGITRTVREGLRDVRARITDDNAWTPLAVRDVAATPFARKQVRIVLENCGEIDPLSLDDYRQRDGMRALERCLKELKPHEVIETVRAAGLRGRGGAGFPTGKKWDLARSAPGDIKYVICNGDEGDPGAFMDRAVLEADPFRVIEGLTIAAYAIGASEGFVYVRREYPIAVRHVRLAIAAAERQGLLGQRILGTGFSFTPQVREGAGAFVCGEETALIQSIEGKRGMPTPRPPYPAQSGLRGRPTIINNVETLAAIPWIFRHGADAFAALGTERSKGTKVFSLAGKINRGGLIEVPMGITIREVVEDVGGGIKGGGTFKAVLAGGPSGGCIPARLADTRIDYEELASTGAIMGSGGLVVLDEHDCAVDIARYFLHFTQDESCGKCTYCRVGTKRMLEILTRICEGGGAEADLETLHALGVRIKKGSLCGLGQTAPNPVLTTLKYFREEYEAHVRERRCPAASCKALIHYRVLDTCTGCTLCAQACPAGAIEARPYVIHEVLDDRCTKCGMCVTACPENAIEVK